MGTPHPQRIPQEGTNMPGSPLRDDAVPAIPATVSWQRTHALPAGERRRRLAAGLSGLGLIAALACGALVLAVAAPSPALADGSSSSPASDAVVGQVLQMLQGGVTSPVILAWLQKSGKRPAAIESADLVALHKAGASDQLLAKLIDLAEPPASGGGETSPAAAAPPPAAPAPPPPPAVAPSSAAPPPPPRAAIPAPPVVAPPPSPAAIPKAPPAPPSAAAIAAPPSSPPVAAPAPAAGAAAAAVGGPVNVQVAVTYRPVFAEYEEPWSLYVYVDGRLLTVVDPGPAMLPLPARKFERLLEPGKHVLRVTQERHRRYNRIVGYLTPSRVDPNDYAFELVVGTPAQIRIHFGEKSLRHPGPVSVRIEQGGREIINAEPPAGNEETWQVLCEDITASMPAGQPLRGPARKDKDHCVAWPALWPAVAAVPSRDEVRAEIDRQRQAQDSK
jgi:hypothetical protein